MGHFKIALLCFFFFTGILISRSAAGRPIHRSVKTEMESKGLDHALPPATVAESPEVSEEGESGEHEKHRHSSGKSVAGGGVIIGGLLTVTFAAVYCYIRVTRKRDGEKY